MEPPLSEMTLEQLLTLIDQRIDIHLTDFWNELRTLDEINQSQIEALVEEVARIEQKLAEILSTPAESLEILEIREEIVDKPKAQRKSRKKKIPAKEVT